MRPGVVIGSVHEKLKDGELADPQTVASLHAAVDDLLAEIAAQQVYRAAA